MLKDEGSSQVKSGRMDTLYHHSFCLSFGNMKISFPPQGIKPADNDEKEDSGSTGARLGRLWSQ
jgi:hypothetical protein